MFSPQTNGQYFNYFHLLVWVFALFRMVFRKTTKLHGQNWKLLLCGQSKQFTKQLEHFPVLSAFLGPNPGIGIHFLCTIIILHFIKL